jgi:HJR/Mrr/RecB family endonuclease
MFQQLPHREEIMRGGAGAARELMQLIQDDPALIESLLRDTLKRVADASEREQLRDHLESLMAPHNEPVTRKVCIRLLAAQYPEATHIGQRMLDFAASSTHETREIRICALKAVAALRPVAPLGRRLILLLRDEDKGIVLEALSMLPQYVGVLQSSELDHELERLVGPTTDLDVRCAAIELLGRFGEIDALERIFLLPLKHEREHSAVQVMVKHLLCKPRSVTQLNPKNFEQLVRRLLEKMGYEAVEVEQKGSWDQGVDVRAHYYEDRLKGRERFKMIGQCKRYQKSNLVGPDVVLKLTETLKQQEAARGVIITTSDFLPAALDVARKHQQIELIRGVELQRLLDTHFDKNFYRVAR